MILINFKATKNTQFHA